MRHVATTESITHDNREYMRVYNDHALANAKGKLVSRSFDCIIHELIYHVVSPMLKINSENLATRYDTSQLYSISLISGVCDFKRL